jgi:hypothetical protein
MWRDERPARIAAGAARLLRLELQLMTGGRALLLLGAQLAWLAAHVAIQRFSEEPPDPVSYYNRTILLPCLLPAIALGMSCILAERDDRHLEMSFASAGGRYLLWSFRLAALALAAAASCLLLSILTRLLLAREIEPFAAAAHALVPIVMAASLAAFLALLFNGTAAAGLVSGGLMAGAGLILHGARATRFDPFLNPFDPPTGLRDPHDWLRLLTFNRMFLLALTGILVAGTLGLVQRRERLL